MSDAITTSGLEVRHDGHVGVTGVSIAVPSGFSVALIGPNGSGKSTLLGAIAGTLEPAAGSVSVAGKSVAFVLQSTEVDETLPISARETVGLARYPSLGLFRRFRSADRSAVEVAMERLRVTEFADRQLNELSGGQRQRVLVAQGLAQGADVLLLDEPATGLDLVSQEIILDVIDAEAAAGRTVAMTTHSLDDAKRCDLVLLLNTSQVAFGPPSETLTEEHLGQAFGTRVVRVGQNLVIDDHTHH